MDDLVKRSDIFRWLCEYCSRMKYCDRKGCADAEIIDSFLHSVDAVEVVRCGECKAFIKGQNESESWEWCKIWERDCDGNGYCSYGKRREDGDGDG